ncbi:MAG: PAS domain-containing protein [Myxococcales bacterium]|nr:PAS domain-containing protein [Myxococcales bacterium]
MSSATPRPPAPTIHDTGSFTGAPPAYVDSARLEANDLAARVTLVAVVRVAMVTAVLALLIVFNWLNPPDRVADVETWQYVLIATVYAASVVYGGLLRVRRLLRPLVHAQAVLDAVVVSVLVLMTGGTESIFTFTYVFAVLGASLTLYRRGGFVAALAVMLLYGVIVLLQVNRSVAVLPRVEASQALLSYFVQALGIASVAVLASNLAERARVTRRQLAEKESDLEQLQELHAAILRSLPAGLLTVDGDGVVRYVNEAAKSILRVDDERSVGRPLLEVVPAMHGPWSRELERPTDRRERFEAEHQRSDGLSIRVGFSFAPLSGGERDVPSVIVVFQDVTDIVRLKEAVERAERLATVGKFAAGLAHEVRNPLASMCASIDVLQSALQIPEPMQRLMGNVVREAERLNRLITDFLAFSRPRKLDLKDVDLGELVQGVLVMFENDELMQRSKIEQQLPLGVRASVDADLVRQVIWNLVKNAGEAMAPQGGTLKIETAMEDMQPILRVKDTGPGIAPDRLRRVFDPFYTTKEGGSGLGLAITYSILEAHGAQMGIESSPGEGTTVTVRFRRDLAGLSVDVPQGTNPGVSPTTDDFEIMTGAT